MPCVDRNGNTVPGVEGQCPIGSTFRRPNGAEIEAMKVYDLPPGSYGRDDEGTSTGEGYFNSRGMSRDDIGQLLNTDFMNDRKPLMDLPDWAQDMAVVGSTALGRGKGDKKALMKSLGSLLNKGKGALNKGKQKFKDMKEFKGQYEPMIPSNVALNLKGKLSGIPSAAAFKSLMNSPEGKKRLIAMGITAPAALMIMNSPSSFFGNGTGDSTTTSTPPAATPNAAEIAAKAEADRVAGLNPLEAMMENMKKPGYWTSPLVEGGPASDNRLNRLGQLMNYYGSTPKQRASMGDPQKGFIKTEETAADNLAAFAKAQATLNASLAGDAKNWSKAEIDKSLGDWFDKKFGIDWWGVGKDRGASKALFLRDAADEKARHPELNLDELANSLLTRYPNRYR